jgi:hypothetical protein
MKRSGFKMRSGNGPLAFKMMGSSPVKQMRDPITPKNVENKDEEVSKKSGIDTQLVKYVGRKIDEWKDKNKIKKEEKNQAKLNSSNNSTEKGSKVEKTDERGATDEEINNMMNHYVENDTVHPSQVESTDIKEKTDTEVDTGEKKKGWKFDIDWNEVGTEAIKTGVKMGIAALSAGTKKPPRRSGSIGSFAAHKFGTNTDITKS